MEKGISMKHNCKVRNSYKIITAYNDILKGITEHVELVLKVPDELDSFSGSSIRDLYCNHFYEQVLSGKYTLIRYSSGFYSIIGTR